VIRTTSFVHLQPGADPQCVDRLVESVRAADGEIDVLAVDAARTTPNSHRAGDVMLLGAFADAEAAARTRAHPYVESVLRPLVEACAAHVETVRYPQGPATLRQPDLTDGIQRTLLLHVNRDTDPALVEQFERDLADMPRYIDSIRNSALSRVETMTDSLGPEYTHVWEQEFVDLDGLTGPYMMHGYHWSLVDAWFDAQAVHPIVDPRLIHASCGLRTSLLACG
jgi:NAD(P)-dependent dehydrogenase (short-subunit alcohol dehydrogenase family)